MSDLQKITEEQMDAVGVCSAPDVLSGSTSENKAVFDKMVRQLVAPAYNAAVDAIEAINQTETGVEAAEAKRAAAESGRVEAEAGRADAEAARVRAEQDRQEAEQTRSDGESARQKAENAREEAEQTRAAAEKSRIDAEAARRQAEQQRVDSTTGIVAQATGQAKAARDSAVLAQSWAVGDTGTREGENTDNARYWAKQAHMAAGGGVVSFNGRTGSVIPKKGDYTAADVGAAPDGYGLGANNPRFPSGYDANQALTSGWWQASVNVPGNAWCLLFVLARGDIVYQEALTDRDASGIESTCRLRRVLFRGTWTQWEWVNPPMQIGVEYRTTERWDKKPVYATIFYFGLLPNASRKTISHNIQNVQSIVNIVAIGSNGAILNDIELAGSNFTANNSVIACQSSVDQSSVTATVLLKYTKTSD